MANHSQTLTWQAFFAPKAGHERAEFEDAFAGDPAAGRFAVADGASESSFAGAWAELLTESFTREPSFRINHLREARGSWYDKFKDRQFSWYTEEKFAEGAYAAFLGVSFDVARAHWDAVAVGDCCLFHVRKQRLLRAFPVTEADAFGNQPCLVGSRQLSSPNAVLDTEGDWRQTDHMFLMTDALAQWFLKSTEDKQQPWREMSAVATQADFDAWIARLRGSTALRNDDVTLMVIGSANG